MLTSAISLTPFAAVLLDEPDTVQTDRVEYIEYDDRAKAGMYHDPSAAIFYSQPVQRPRCHGSNRSKAPRSRSFRRLVNA